MERDNTLPDRQMPASLPELSALFFVVPDGMGSRAGKIAAAHGAGGGTLFYGSGTASNKVLKFLGLEDARKEVLLTLVASASVEAILRECVRTLEMQQPGSGIAFAIPVPISAGLRASGSSEPNHREECGDMSFQHEHDLIFTIVERGFAEDVVEASRAAGASGGTIITGRGTGVHETGTFFGIKIEPEKEIVLTLVPSNLTAGVMERVNRDLRLDQPGKGISFSMPVTHTGGISHGEHHGQVK